MLGTAAGILFGVSDVAIKALTGAVGDIGHRRPAVAVADDLHPRLGDRLLRVVRAGFRRARPSRSSPSPARPPTSPRSAAASWSSATRCPATPSAWCFRASPSCWSIVAAALTPAPLRATQDRRLSANSEIAVGEHLGVVRHRRVPQALEVAQLRAGDQALEARAPGAAAGSRPWSPRAATPGSRARAARAAGGPERRRRSAACLARSRTARPARPCRRGRPARACRAPARRTACGRPGCAGAALAPARCAPPTACSAAPRGPRPAPAGGPGRRARSR